MRRTLAAAVAVLAVVGCAGSTATPLPATRTTPAPAPVGLSDVGLTAAVIDNIRVLYADSEWYPFVTLAGGDLDVAARDGVVFVGGVPPTYADSACRSIAAASFDEDGMPLGILAVVIVYDMEEAARCEPL